MRRWMHQAIIVWLAIWAAATIAFAEFQSFTNGEGHRIEAELLEMKADGSVVAIKLRDGRKVDAALSAFSKKDQKTIRDWWAKVLADKALLQPRHRIDLTVKLNRKAKSDRYDGYFTNLDDTTQSFFPELIIENDEMDAFAGNEIRLVILAEDKRYEGRLLVVSATTEKDMRFPDLGETYLEGEPFRLRHYEYKSTYSTSYDYEYGYEYDGYIVVIKNGKGQITHTKASKTKFLSNIEAITNCAAGQVYDEDFNRQLDVTPNSYFVR